MELYLKPVLPTRNKLNGRFMKGHTPHNKGKKWRDYMDMRKARKLRRCLDEGRVGNPNLAGWNKKKVIGIKDSRIIGVFESATEAANKLQLTRRNITHCCNGKRKHCGGIKWFFESDINTWVKHIENNSN